MTSRLAANQPVPGLQAGAQEVNPCFPHPGTLEQSRSSTPTPHSLPHRDVRGLCRMHREESTQPLIALTLPELQQCRKQVASLFLLCWGPVFISFLPVCVRENPETQHEDHLFHSLSPPSQSHFTSSLSGSSPDCVIPALLSPAATLLEGHCSCLTEHPCACVCVCKHTSACV